MISQDGDKIGNIQDIYLDRETDQPEWALVNTGFFGTRGTFVPLAQASMEGDDIRVPYSNEQVKDAPNMDPDGELSQEEEAELYRYYGLDYAEYRSDTGLPEGGREGVDRESTTDEAMTRSEEELRVGKTEKEAGRARLRKYVTTEQVRGTVPLEREQVRVEREPITEANVDQATSGPEISEEEHEVMLREEQPVVEKQAVPKERVRLSKDVTTEEHEVSEEVRKEQIEQEGDVRR
jgi:uncharacterized protein (TIGR02271 family)